MQFIYRTLLNRLRAVRAFCRCFCHRLRNLVLLVLVLGASSADAGAATNTFDLCVQAQGKELTQSVRLALIVKGVDPGEHADALGAAMARRLIWKERAEHVYAERYDPLLCAAARDRHTIEITLTQDDLQQLLSVRGPEDDNEVFTKIAKPALQSIDLASTSSPEGTTAYHLVRVYFATNREDTKNTDRAKRYGNGRGKLAYGAVAVAIPRDHQMGVLETPSIFKLEFRKDPARHVSLESIEVLAKEKWRSELQQRASRQGKPGLLLFIHGYNVSFSDAAERSGQLAQDLAFPGPTLFFAWPSQGGLAKYIVDEQMAEYSVLDMKALLAELADMAPGGPVYVIAHSMGNRVLTRGFAELMATDLGKRRSFKEIVLAAPDIDAEVFRREIAPKILVPGPRFTLYSNSNDKALRASDGVHGAPRLGEGGDGITIIRDVDSIDASQIKTDFLGHSYFGDTETLLSDLFHLIRTGDKPENRFRLEPATHRDGKYWRFKR